MDRTLARRVLGATEKTYEPAYFIAIDPDVARDSCSRMNAGQMLAKCWPNMVWRVISVSYVTASPVITLQFPILAKSSC